MRRLLLLGLFMAEILSLGAEPKLLGVDETRIFLKQLTNENVLKVIPTSKLPSDWKPRGPYYDLFYLGDTNIAISGLPGSFSDAASAFQLIYQAFTRPIAYRELTNSPLPLPENMVWAAKALQALRKYPDVYEHAAVTNKGDAQQIYFRDLPQGQGSPYINAFSFKCGGAEFKLSSTRTNLLIHFDAPDDTLEFTLHHSARHGKFWIKRGSASGRNHSGQKLVLSNIQFMEAKRLRGSIEIPYSKVKGQASWMIGTEHGAYQLECDEDIQQLYFASEEEPVRLWLEHEVGEGLRLWQAHLAKANATTEIRRHLFEAADLWLRYIRPE